MIEPVGPAKPAKRRWWQGKGTTRPQPVGPTQPPFPGHYPPYGTTPVPRAQVLPQPGVAPPSGRPEG